MSISLTDIINSINQMHAVTQIPMTIFNKNNHTIHFVPNSESFIIPERFYDVYVNLHANRSLEDYFPLMITRRSTLMIGLIKLPDSNYLLVGPVSETTISFSELSQAYSKILTKEELQQSYRIHKNAQHAAPIRFANLLSCLIMTIYQKNILPMEIIQLNYSKPAEQITLPSLTQNEIGVPEELSCNSITISIAESLLQFENKIFAAIRVGSLSDLDELWKAPPAFLQSGADPTEDFRHYWAVPFLALANRSAITGGAPFSEAYPLYQQYLILLNKATDFMNGYALIIQSTYDYCNMVRRSQGKEALPEICRACEKYINEHICEKIRAEDLARYCCVSKRKLYTVFETYFQTTISEYIQQERLRRALVMMESPHFSLSQISATLGYASPSYFGKVFAKYYGCSPSEYLNKSKNGDQ